MGVLAVPLRRQLERTVLAARKAGETGAGKVLRALGVDQAKAPPHLTNEQQDLRHRLTAQAYMLGDGPDLKHLIEKVAYNHWHRLLFSRFLLENQMLLHPEHRVALEFSDLSDLAGEEGIREPWDLAARYTAGVLPAIFRPDDPVGELALPSEDRGELLRLLKELPTDVFQTDDSLGWVYQFWRAEEKAAVNKAGDKIDADTLPAVTQLFTEHYMVEFLLHNTLGAWWTAKVETAGRTSAIPLPYLRRKDDGSPAAGAFPGWPKTVRELRMLDPCGGSGHFLVALLQLLVAMLREEEKMKGLNDPGVEEAVRVVLGEILHGLEIDARCTQLAAFNVAFAAWKLIGRPVELPSLRMACSGLSVGTPREEWLAAVEDKEARFLIGQLYDLFKKAPELGSLINPARLSNIGRKASDLLPAARGLLEFDPLANPERHELGVTAKGLADAAGILDGLFHLVVTNVPYLGSGKQDDVLKEFCERQHPDAAADLATCFVERCVSFCREGGTTALVTPQNWLFLRTYRNLRARMLETVTWDLVVRLGARAFETIGGEVVNVALLSITRAVPSPSQAFMALDVSAEKTPADKTRNLLTQAPLSIPQQPQRANPDSIIQLDSPSTDKRVAHYAFVRGGITSGDSPYFRKRFWEVDCSDKRWSFQQSTVDDVADYAGREYVLLWEDGKGLLAKRTGGGGATIAGRDAWRHKGIAITYMSGLKATLYGGELFENVICVLVPKDEQHLPALWAFCSSDAFPQAVRVVNQKLSVDVRYFEKATFDLAHWQQVAAEKYPNGLPKPHSDDPTQWLFNGHPRGSDHPLQVAVSRLLGYRWPRQTGSEFPDCPALGPDGLEAFIDDDGIVCVNAIKGETPAADRLQSLLAAAYGAEWSAGMLSQLLAPSGARSLEDWLRNHFFEEHCTIFHQRPFLWHVWDGRKDGFSAIVNYHRFDRATLEKLTYAYLGDWLRRQQAAIEAEEPGSDARHQAAIELQTKLRLIVEGEPPYDIFVRWKPLEKQPIGWEPDLNDGVRMNIHPFVIAELLRKTPKINWRKDRGKDVSSAPWYRVFEGERINDHHLTVAQKRAARS
jgi:hypothetical protein